MQGAGASNDPPAPPPYQQVQPPPPPYHQEPNPPAPHHYSQQAPSPYQKQQFGTGPGQPPVPPPPPPGYSNPTWGSPAQAAHPTVIVAEPRSNRLGDVPARVQCPNCNLDVTTEIRRVEGPLVYLLCGGLVLVGCWMGCCLIPFCIDDFKDVIHACPRCKRDLGSHGRILS